MNSYHNKLVLVLQHELTEILEKNEDYKCTGMPISSSVGHRSSVKQFVVCFEKRML
jgi:hypothetical protein